MSKIQIANQPVGPFPAMIVGAMVEGKPTYTAVGAGGCACLEPVLCVSLKDSHYITAGIRDSGWFSVNIPSRALVRELDYCGIVSGRDTDKSRLFTGFFSQGDRAPLIEECPLNFLCRVCDSKEIQGFTMFFGDIQAVYIDESCLADGRPDPLLIDPVIMMAVTYCGLGSIIGQPFAEGRKLLSG